MRRLVLIALPFLSLAGCASDNPASADNNATKQDVLGGHLAAPTDVKPSGEQPKPGSGALVHVPPMMQEQMDPAEAAKLTKELDGLKATYESAKAAYEKNPKDEKAEEAFVTAAVKYGHESMMSPVLSAKVKYRQALEVYREVLEIDPTNPVAKPESDMIISIYQSMKRPIPN